MVSKMTKMIRQILEVTRMSRKIVKITRTTNKMLFIASLKNTQDFGKKKIQCVAPRDTKVCL